MTTKGQDRDEIVRGLIERALAEDVGPGDWTTLWTVPEGAQGEAMIVAKASLVVAGSDIMARVFRTLDPSVHIEMLAADGDARAPETPLARLHGSARALLTAERTALNFLGRLSGVATLTARYVEAVSGTGARIVDTRKTTPGWRLLEKEAVRAGGGSNHRMGLHDMVMIKDNHAMAAGGIARAMERVRHANARGLPVEVEVRTLDELDETLAGLPDRILLDNMSLDLLRAAVERVREWRKENAGSGPPSGARGVEAGGEPRRTAAAPELEASGNMSLDRVRAVAGTGVDLISVGALTHSAPTADVSMRMKQPARR